MTLPLAGPETPAAGQVHLAQVFGPTIQGEGRERGRRANFVRFAGCNLTCKWCDTPYTWDKDRGMRDWCQPVPVAAVLDYLDAHPAGLLVITGGEPLLHQRSAGMGQLMFWATEHKVDVEFETNGTLVPDRRWLGDDALFNVSPKLAHSGDPEGKRIVPQALGMFASLAARDRADFKFVATGPDDLDEIAALVERFEIPASTVWVMPEGTTAEKVLITARELADPVITRGWNLTLRDHVLLWNDDRSR